MRSLLLLAVLLVAAPAHAMGRYVNLGVVAWNADGTAVILSRSESSSGTAGITLQYLLIGAREPDPIVVSFNDTQDPDTSSQKIDPATCVKNAAAFQTALTAHRFRGVTVHAERCKTDRAVLQLSAYAARQVAASEITSTTRPPRSLRELHAADAVALAMGDSEPPSAIESLTGDLTVILFGGNGDESGPGHAIVVATTPTGPRVVGGDLRN